MAPEAPKGMVDLLPAQKKKGVKNAAPANGASPIPNWPPEALREQGNELFRRGDYGAAAARYAEALKVKADDAMTLANRAECYLRVRQFHLALVDADAALAADPSHHKALYKRAMALNGLGRYPDAIKTLKQLLDKEPEDPAALNALAECELLQSQAFAGDYHMPSLLFGRSATSFRRCADYVGPVKIVGDRPFGRGVVTTRAMRAGELICVASPLAVAPLTAGAEAALMGGLVGAASRNPQDLAVILALPSGANDDADAGKVPPIDVAKFRRHLSKGDEVLPELPPQEVFARLAANVVKTSAVRNASSVGVYPFPSFLNHSCAPNACKLMVGHTMFIRAARDLVAGEEVFMKYFDVTMPKPERSAVAKRWGFECACPRCKLEAVGEDEAAAATERASKQAKAAKDAAVADPANKKKGGDKDGEKAAARAAAESLGAEDTGSVAMLIAQLRAKAKELHGDISRQMAEYKRTKGKSAAPDPNHLVELTVWFEAQMDALGLSETQKAWARTSVIQVYSNVQLCLNAAGQLEARAEMLGKVAATLNATDPCSYDHVKQTAIKVIHQRVAAGGAGKDKIIAAAEAEAAAVHSLRYGCGGGSDEEEKELMAEMIKITGHAVEEGAQEFCEA